MTRIVSADGPAGSGALRARRWLNRLRLTGLRPERLAGWIALVVLGYLIVVPLIEMAINTLVVQVGDARRTGGNVGEFTAFYWQRMVASAFAGQLFYRPLVNTLVVSAGYTVLAMAMGVTLAWLLVKTDMPYRKLIGALAIVPYVLPSWSIAMAWVIAFRSDGVGVGARGLVQIVTGIAPPDWLVYGPVAIVLVLAINYFAYAYLLAAAAFARIDASLEEAALIHGAATVTRFRLVILPIILPALGSAFILTFAQGLGSFGVPAVLGFPDRYYVLSTILFQSAGVGRFSDAYVLAFFLIGISALTIYANSLVLGRRRQFTTITGKGSRSRVTSLGRFRRPVAFALIGLLALLGIGPILLLALQSLQFRLDDFSLANLSLTYWTGYTDGFHGILVDPRVWSAARNTVILGISVALITAFTGIVIGYVLVKERGTRFASVIEQVSFLPFLIPAIAFGLIYLSMFAQPRGPIPALYGTMYILILACAVNRLPFATRTGVAAMTQVSRSLEEAAEIQGAGLFTRFRRVLLPLTRHGFLAGFILSFVSTVKDLSLVILLVTPSTTLLTVMAYGYLDLGRPQFAYAVSLIIIAIVLVGTWLVRRITRADPFRGLGGGGE